MAKENLELKPLLSLPFLSHPLSPTLSPLSIPHPLYTLLFIFDDMVSYKWRSLDRFGCLGKFPLAIKVM